MGGLVLVLVSANYPMATSMDDNKRSTHNNQEPEKQKKPPEGGLCNPSIRMCRVFFSA